MDKLRDMNCSVARALAEVGERWSLLIVREAMMGSRRFDEFHSRLGIARNILSDRLASLVEHGILDRMPSGVSARIFEYRLTTKGEALFPVIVSLLQWGDHWLNGGKGPPVLLQDKVTGGKIGAVVVTAAKPTKSLTVHEVRIVPGRGANSRTRHRLERLGKGRRADEA